MPHISFVALSGIRVREAELASLGMSLPGLQSRLAAISALPPLGLLTLAGMTPDHWTMSLHEARSANDDLVHQIVGERPTLVAISALTASILEAYQLASHLRSNDIRVVLGGLHVTAAPDEASLHADAIVVGEGEPVWLELLSDAERGALRPRYKASGAFDLAQAPLPRLDLLGPSTRPRLTMQATRGCPLACDFCAASRLLGPFRCKPALRIREELAAIAKIDPSACIELADDNTFALGGPHDDLLDALGDSGLKWFTEADWRVGENPHVLRRLADSGCVQVLVGIESLVHQHGGMGIKRTSITRIMDAIESIQSTGVIVIGCYIVGSEGETHESIDRLSAFLENDPCADVQLTLQTPFPGTALRQKLQSQGRLLPDRDWSHHTLFDVTHQPSHMSPAELQSAFTSLIARTFAPQASRRRQSKRRHIWRGNSSLTL